MKAVILLLFLTALLITDPQFVQAQKAERTPDEYLTPLMRAAEAGRLDDVRNLLKARANVNERLDGIGLTALMLAAGRGHLEVVKVLLDAGADPNAAGGVAHAGFWTPLTMAMDKRNKNRLELVDTLIAAGAKLNPARWFPESPLFAAVKDNDIEIMKALLKRGSDVNWENEIGNTALVTAISLGEPSVEVVRLLLNAGADPNKPRLWIGEDCVSIRQSLDEGLKMSRDKVREEILRLVIQAGGRKYSARSNGKPCKH